MSKVLSVLFALLLVVEMVGVAYLTLVAFVGIPSSPSRLWEWLAILVAVMTELSFMLLIVWVLRRAFKAW
jgi:hypothetical protein